MSEIQALLGKIYDDVRGSWRYRWWALAVAWTICVAGWFYVMSLPNVYQASARVYLDTQSSLRPLLQGLAVNPDVESDLALVKQALISRPQLEEVARETGLDLKIKTAEDKERMIAGLQKNIVIQNDARVSSSSTDGLYRISFQYQSRVQALGVVQELLDNFVENTLGNKRAGQEGAQRFLQDQIAEYEQRLTEAENRLSQFKKSNVGRMPTDQGDYFQRLQTEQSALDAARQALNLATTRRDEVARQLAGEDPLLFGLDTGTQDTNTGKGDLANRIRDMQARLEELLLNYTDKHPEVVALRNTLTELKQQQDQELARIKQGQRTTGSLASSLKTNPVYQNLQVERNRTEVQVAELRQDVAQREARVAQLRGMVNSVPEVEAELSRLNRDYEVTRTQYQQLVQRLETAKLSESADKTGTVSFQIIEPPAVQQEPVSPKRTMLLVGVLIAGILGATAIAYGMNLLHPVFQNVSAVESATGLQVLGCVGHVSNEQDESRERRAMLLFSAAAVMLIVAYGGVVALSTLNDGVLLERLIN